MPKLKSPLFSLAAHGKLCPYYYSKRDGMSLGHAIGQALIWISKTALMTQYAMVASAAVWWSQRTQQEDTLFKSLQHRIPKPYQSSSPRARWTPYTLYMHYRLLMGIDGLDPVKWQAKVDDLWSRYM